MISYYLLVPILLAFSYLPSAVLYKLAEVIAFVLDKIIGYRRKVVMANLLQAFPEKTEAERKAIATQSYRHLGYHVVETIKCFTITAPEVQKRVTILNPEMISDCYAAGRHVVLMVGHIASWEYGGYKASLYYPYKTCAVVSLVSNPYFNRLIQKSRGKFGMHLIMQRDSREFFEMQPKELTMAILISDQSPSNLKSACWDVFFNRQTAFFTGAERYARKHNCVVIYPKIVQGEPGMYTAELIKITDTPNELPEFGVTKKYIRILEQHIKEHPADWLWSHKRWKHSPPVTV